MRRIVASIVVMGGVTLQVIAFQAERRGAATGQARLGACSLLTKDVVTQVSPADKQVLALTMRIPPTEDALGASGSACTYGGITLQVDPFAPAAFERLRDKTWVPVPGIGSGAYFRDNEGRYAELYVRTAAHVLTIQMDVPDGKTADAVRPNTIALAKALLPKLP